MLKRQLYTVFSVVLLSLIQCTGNEQQNQESAKTNFNKKLILGTWKDSNSIVTYFENKTFDGWFGDGNKRFHGYYNIVSDTLKISFATHEYNPAYIIEKMDSHIFNIRSLDDNALFIKRKIKIVEQIPEK